MQKVGNFWEEKRAQLRYHLENEDFANFLRWPEVAITMFVGNFPFIKPEKETVADHGWLEKIYESEVGNPELWPATQTSSNWIHQAYHLVNLEKVTGVKIADLKSIGEIGAGYGAMRTVLSRLGFKGNYYIYDLPEYAELQHRYLSQTLTEEELAKTVWELPQKVDLLIGMWSLSEMPVGIRKELLQACASDYYLFGYHEFFEGVYNVDWFEKLQQAMTRHLTSITKLAHMDGDHFYFIGQTAKPVRKLRSKK